jgi:hypothetical protein
MAKNIKKFVYRPNNFWGKEIEYVMPRDEFEAIASKRERNVDPWRFVLDYINDTFHLLGTVTALSVEEKIPRDILHAVMEE